MDDTLELKVEGKVFDRWSSVSVATGVESIASSYSLVSNFSLQNKKIRDLFRPAGFEKVVLSLNGNDVITAVNEDLSLDLTESGNSVSLTGRSLPGILTETAVPVDTLALANLTLGKLAQRLGDAVGVKVRIVDDSPKISSIVISPGNKIFDTLNEYAKEYSLIFYDDPNGELVMRKNPVPSNSRKVFEFVEGETPFRVSAQYDGNALFSAHTAVSQAKADVGSKKTVTDNLTKRKAFNVFTVDKRDSLSLTEAVERERALSYARFMTAEIGVSGWNNPRTRDIWKKGDSVAVKSPSVYIDRETEFVIADLTYSLDAGNYSTSMKLVLPQMWENRPFKPFWRQ
jgi:prophage tail gpP-like protein